jgi:hypothetical protein
MFSPWNLQPVKGKTLSVVNVYAYCKGINTVIDKSLYEILEEMLAQSGSHVLKHSKSGKYYMLFVLESDGEKTHYVGEMNDKIFQGEIEVRACLDKVDLIVSRGWAKIAVDKSNNLYGRNPEQWLLSGSISLKYTLGTYNPLVFLKKPNGKSEVGFGLSELN